MQPRTYLELAELLAPKCRVIIPSLFVGPGRWSDRSVVSDLADILDKLQLEGVTLIGHSFGGALALEFATRHPERVTELVFVDTLAMSREWTLAAEALHPIHLLWMASARAAIDFAHSWATHPLQLVGAAWWGFTSDRREQVAVLAGTDIPRHVLWADRDSLLSRPDGERFARDLGADFTVVHAENGGPVDHDWMYRHPHLALAQFEQLGLVALRGPGRPQRPPAEPGRPQRPPAGPGRPQRPPAGPGRPQRPEGRP